ncbi:guanitoxin biosynthesis L-enduracididine beta-hydroxylase GntD [Micromonospora sp. NPDC048999]|uniref:guanitoxin biosynthesis L-enduracididine beta-hydroxylase GntD n=1 Tax=Micromonospora sp. NPDC048999 TaxID=3155391 RepID=UPI0033CB0653
MTHVYAQPAVLDRPVEHRLTDVEARSVLALATELTAGGADPADPAFYDRAWPVLDRLPHGLRWFLERFRREEPAAACLIHGFPVDDAGIGPTPEHWEAAARRPVTARLHEAWLALCGMVLGEPFTWSTLQSGRLIQSILPMRGDEQRQNGYGSEAILEFHTEDGFHPRRCDYLLLLGLRNPDAVPTLLASVRDLDLDAGHRAVLAQPRFHIVPDDEHLLQLAARDPRHPALARMRAMHRDPEPVAVLFGGHRRPYLRIDRPFMRCAAGDADAEAALDALMAALERVRQDVVVGPGSLLVVDNYLAVHGRRSFAARYDGTDRWLKKLTVSRNLRRFADHADATHRVQF